MIVRSVQRMVLALVLALLVTTAHAQQPRPFPQPSEPRPTTPAKPSTPPASPRTTPPLPSGAPDEATLGVAVYPGAQFLASYDAGRGQRFYLFGVTLPFADAVTYYRNVLNTRGDVLFESPPTHQFDIGNFDEDRMAFPPSVTIKDYTFGGSAGYPNPAPGADPPSFPTVIQIVPPPPARAPATASSAQ